MMGGESITKMFSTSIMGSSHKDRGIPCQDHSLHSQNEDYHLVAVSDGHGSAPHFRSHEGSRMAVESVRDVVSDCMNQDGFMESLKNDPESTIRLLCNAVIAKWRSEVDRDVEDVPLSSSESEHMRDNGLEDMDPVRWYGATLVAGVMCKDMVFGFQIGDGDLVLVHEADGPLKPIPVDEDCFLNRTTSICSADASQKFRFFTTLPPDDDASSKYTVKSNDPTICRILPLESDSIKAMMVCTDGLTTSFNSEESFLRYCGPACEAICTNEGMEGLIHNLELRSRSNMEDDVSVAIVIRKDDENHPDKVRPVNLDMRLKRRRRKALKNRSRRKNNRR